MIPGPTWKWEPTANEALLIFLCPHPACAAAHPSARPLLSGQEFPDSKARERGTSDVDNVILRVTSNQLVTETFIAF